MEKGVTAEKYLSRSLLHHMDMLESLRRGNTEVIYESSYGVLLRNPEIECWLISAATPEESGKMLDIPEKLDFVCAHQDFTVKQLRRRYDFSFYLDCIQTAYLKEEPVPEKKVCEFRLMKPEDAAWVNTNYRNIPEELEYVRHLLKNGLITGAFVDGSCAGFIGRHSEGSIGLLEVIPEYRRRGIGDALARNALNLELSRGNIPFGQIVWDNEPSIALHRRLGYEFSEGHVYWMDLVNKQ